MSKLVFSSRLIKQGPAYIGVPVELTQTFGLKFDDCGCDGLRDGEIRGINLAESSTMAWDRLGGMLVGVIDIGAIALQSTLRRLVSIRADSAIQNVWELGGNIVKDRGIHTKVLGKDFLGSVRNPIIDHEGGSMIVSV